MPSHSRIRLPFFRLIASGVIALLTLAAITILSAFDEPEFKWPFREREWGWGSEEFVDRTDPNDPVYYFRDDRLLRTRLMHVMPQDDPNDEYKDPRLLHEPRALPSWSDLGEKKPRLVFNEAAAGWPLRCFYAYHRLGPAEERAGRTFHPLELHGGVEIPRSWSPFRQTPRGRPFVLVAPLIPIPLPLIVNFSLYFAAAFVLVSVPVWIRRGVRAWRGTCPHCGYGLAGIDADRCPECGHVFSGRLRRRAAAAGG